MTDSNMGRVSEMRYREAPPKHSVGGNPWGGLRSRSVPVGDTSGAAPADNAYTYTGQRQEADLGLMFYNARWYDSALGRFVQADSIIPDPYNPQDYDRYTYVRNNPVNFIDPTGHFTDGEIRQYLHETYGKEDYEAYYRAWKGDKLFWGMLRAAQYGDILYAPESGLSSLSFSKNGNAFSTVGENGLYKYQGTGSYRLLYNLASNRGASYRDLPFEDFYSNNGAVYTPFLSTEFHDGYLQPQYDYSSGVPIYTKNVRWVAYERTLSPKIDSGSGVAYLMSQITNIKNIAEFLPFIGPVLRTGTALNYINTGILRCQVTINASTIINEAEFTPMMGDPKVLPHKR